MKKLSTKFMVVTLCCCVFVSLLISGFSLYLGSRFIKEEAIDKLNYMASSYGNKFSQSIKQTESYADALHSYILTSFDMKSFREDPFYLEKYENEIDIFMNQFASNHNDAFGMYVTFNPDYTNGEFIELWYEDFTKTGILQRVESDMRLKYPQIFKEGWTYPCVNSLDRNEPGMKFLYDTMDAKRPLWFKPYREIGLDNTTLAGETVISYVVPIIIDDIVIGVVGMDFNFVATQKTIAEMNIYKQGYAFLMDEKNNVLVHPSKDSADLEEIVHLIDADKMNDSGVISYHDQGVDKILGYSKLSNGWVLVLVPTREEIFRPVWSLSLLIAFMTFLGLLLSLALANLFTKKVKKRFDRVTDQLRFIEDGDYYKEIPEELLNGNDDLGYVVKAIRTMQVIIRNLVQEIESKDAGVKDTDLSNITEQTHNVTSNAVIAIEQLSLERVEKEENLRETLKKLEELNARLQSMVDEEVLKNRQKDAVLLYQSRFTKMGEMVGNIAHQWRQPLNSLTILLSELKDSIDYNDLDREHFEQVIVKSNNIIQNMSQTMNDFRDFLRPSKQKTKFSIYKAVKFSLSLTEESIKSNNIAVNIDLTEDADIYGYESEFSQVILNIIHNSKDALEEVHDKKRLIHIQIGIMGRCAEIKIFNNGPQIPREVLDNMFAPYFSTKTLEKGTGLGLYMSRIIIDEHMDGNIAFQNVDGGVICRIYLPLGDAGEFRGKGARHEQ